MKNNRHYTEDSYSETVKELGYLSKIFLALALVGVIPCIATVIGKVSDDPSPENLVLFLVIVSYIGLYFFKIVPAIEKQAKKDLQEAIKKKISDVGVQQR